jgi:rubrerythrin
MARALDRFRVLPLADPPAQPSSESPSADLFEHFGVALEARAPARPRPVVEVRACRHCGWWLAVDSTEPCPVCAGPSDP